MLWFNLFSPELSKDKPPCALVVGVIGSFVQTSVVRKLQTSLGIEGCSVHVEPRKETLGLVGSRLVLFSTDLTGVDAIERKQHVC